MPTVIELEGWDEPVDPADPHANFKAEVATWSPADPMETLVPFAEMVGLPVGAVARFVLARWAAEGSAARLELGPQAIERLWQATEEAEEAGDDAGRLAGYRKLREILSWMRLDPESPSGRESAHPS